MIFLRVFNFVIFFSSLRFSVLGEHGFDDCNRLCETDGSNAYFDWDTTTDESFVIVKTNQCAQHEIENGVGENPNRACSAFPSIDFYIPKVPVYRDNSSGINDNILYNEGSSLISISGGIMYGPAIGPNGGDAGTHEIDTFDYCGSHADPDGILHYHVEPYCITLAANETEVGTVLNPTHKHSILFGWSPDGFPVYGPLGDDGEEPDDLDECQGHASDSGAGGGYHYHYTGPLGPFPQDSNDVGGYPYYMACFKGCIPDETVNADDLQAETYAECLSSSFDAPSGSYSAEFFDSFSGLDFSNIKFVLSDATDSPTTSPTISPTNLPSVSPTGSASTGVGQDYNITYYEGVGWCKGMDVGIDFNRPDTDDYKEVMFACWEACYEIYGEALVAVDGPCYCQDECDELSCDGQSIFVRSDIDLPNNCDSGFDEDGCTWSKCTDTGNDCYASEEWGEPQTCDDGLLPVPQYDVDQNSYKCCGVDYAGCVDDKCTSLADDCYANEEEWGEPQTCDDGLLPVTTWWSEYEYRCCGVLGNDFSNGCTSDDDCNSSQSCICKERRLRSKKSKKISEKTVGDRSLLFGKYDDCFCA